MARKVVLTCALTGVLTDPEIHQVPVTPEQMADHAEQAWNAGATIVHLHFRDQSPGLGRFPSWEPEVALAVSEAIRARCPRLLQNFSTGVFGDDIAGPVACLRAGRPELAALNAGSLNYLKLRSGGDWAWPPMVFDNPVDKIERFLAVMKELNVVPECECFDTGIVRSVAMFHQRGMLHDPVHLSLVMGVASGMPCDPRWLPLLADEMPPGALWQVIAIGRQEVWGLHRRAVELGGHVRTGLEDTFYLPDGAKTGSNGALVEALAGVVRDAGGEVANIDDTRAILGFS
ncbi:MAG: 3-keto-5-aminohexanoate cleavage protein [Deltaproteobacteria bacterium]|nr:3-keto-5-aminohexanoate cleavage protein [Deltaproteobacteria bacterium]